MRTIRLEAEIAVVCNAHGIPVPEVHRAIGYLSSWALAADCYAHVWISLTDDGDVAAVYSATPEGPTTYLIGAVWQDDHYSFHS